MEDLVIVESKDYAQVVFEDVRECYAESHSVECFFNLNELLKASDADWIGVYKVGFGNYKDFVCIRQVDLRSIVDNKGKILFDAEQVPKDDGEFYQFVYVSHAKQIRGASIPFQFKRSHLSDYVEIEDQEAIVYKSKESAINDTIIEIRSRCDHLAQANETYEKLIKENEEIIHSLKDEIAEVKLRCMRLTMDNEKLNSTLRAKTDNLKNLADTINHLTDENKRLQTKFDSLSAENMSLCETLQQRVEQVEQLKNDLKAVKTSKKELENEINHKEEELSELRKNKHELSRIANDLVNINDQVTHLEKQVNERVEELNKIKSDLRRNELLVTQQAETIQKILDERDSLNDLIQQLTKEKNELEYNQENLCQELSMSKDKLQAAEQCKEMLRSQVLVLTNELNSSNSKIESYLAKLNEYTNREKQLSAENDELHGRMQKMKQEYESKLDEANGSYYALKLAHTHLENKLKTAEQTGKEKSSTAQKELDYYLQMIDKLKYENEELKDRIKTGAKEYSKLLEKYQHVKNNQMSQDTVSSVIYHDMNGIERRGSENRAPRQSVLDRFKNQYSGRNEAAAAMGDTDSDSAIQDKTLSQSTRLSTSADVEHTLLDALLSTSLYAWQGPNRNKEQQQQQMPGPTMMPITTTCQPRLQASRHNEIMTSSGYNSSSSNANINNFPQTTSDISDDGLIHATNQLRYRGGKRSSFEDSAEMANEVAANKTLNAVNNLIKLVSDQPSQSSASDAANTSSNIRVCDICNHIFEPDLGPHEVEKHMSLHYGPSCPVCYLLFRKGFPQKDYEDHVNSHFAN